MRLDLSPVQPAIACTQGGQCDGLHVVEYDPSAKRCQSLYDPFDARVAAPVLLGWEINNPARPVQLSGFRHEHEAGFDALLLACSCVKLVVLVKPISEHERNAFTHDTHSVHGIYKRLSA